MEYLINNPCISILWGYILTWSVRGHYSISLQWSIHWRLPKYMLTQYCSSDPWIKCASDLSHYKFNGRNAPIPLKNATFDSVINSSINIFPMLLSNEYSSWTIPAYCFVASSTFKVPFYIEDIQNSLSVTEDIYGIIT